MELEVTSIPKRAEPLINRTLCDVHDRHDVRQHRRQHVRRAAALYLKELGASVGQIGLFFTLSQIIPLAMQILGGWVSDTLGRLRSVALGSVAETYLCWLPDRPDLAFAC